MITHVVRQTFLNYFKKCQHEIVSSSPVIPHEDPTLLFTNAGMNQFKDVFLGQTSRDYTRAATSQKCIRAGGKHNDLDNVGHTKRHLTFFEMLGNFSFGDYFKADAIRFSWELTTEGLGITPDKLHATVFLDDDEAFELWKKHLPEARIHRLGEEENFWAMGDVGPCGPCSELYFDRGPKYGTAETLEEDVVGQGDRFVEFWNLVFMQYNRDTEGVMTELPKPSIDTGMGIERLLTLMNDTHSVFETDVLRELIAGVENVSGKVYDPTDEHSAAPFRVIADHMRSLCFSIADGAQPSNLERGYVLRKILRRAVRYGKSLGLNKPFLGKLLPRLIDKMGSDYPELQKSKARIEEILTSEEEGFFRTLKRGGNILEGVIERSTEVISGDDAFKLKDTYGLPLEEILLIAKDNELHVDEKRYRELEIEAKERSRKKQKNVAQVAENNLFEMFPQTLFTGYDTLEGNAEVVGLVKDGVSVDTLSAGDEGLVILNTSPFYAEMGGQVGDKGRLENSSLCFDVFDCQAPYKGVTAHFGTLKEGGIQVGDSVKAHVDESKRRQTANNHTATHLLHWALHKVLGDHVKQAGSVVEPKRLRFDFSHHKSLSTKELREIEALVNEKIRANEAIATFEIPLAEAEKQDDIKMFFGDKYGNTVRVVEVGNVKELCGGTHTGRSGNIGLFKITREGSIAAGVRRIEAVSGVEAEQLFYDQEERIEKIAKELKTTPQKLETRLEKLLLEAEQLQAELKAHKEQELETAATTLIKEVQSIDGIPLIAAELSLSPKKLRPLVEKIGSQQTSYVVFVAAKSDDGCQIMARVSPDLIQKGIKANELVGTLAPMIEGRGGGKPEHAQAGGKSSERLDEVFVRLKELLKV